MQRPLTRIHRLGAAGLLLGLVALLPPPAWASDQPQQGRAESAPGQETESILAPETLFMELGYLLPELSLPPLHAADPGSREALMTNGALDGEPGELNALERAKLQMAREAVAAAEAAGTLPLQAPQGPPAMLAPEHWDALKFELMLQMEPKPMGPYTGDGMSKENHFTHEFGPAGLTELEKAKLAGEDLAPFEDPVIIDEKQPEDRSHLEGKANTGEVQR